jgi:hypothetical protein
MDSRDGSRLSSSKTVFRSCQKEQRHDGGYRNNEHIVALGWDRLQVIVPTRSATRDKGEKAVPETGA